MSCDDVLGNPCPFCTSPLDRVRDRIKGDKAVELEPSEREALEDKLIDKYSAWLTDIEDQGLIEEGVDKGVL